jgi:hypothetical protein
VQLYKLKNIPEINSTITSDAAEMSEILNRVQLKMPIPKPIMIRMNPIMAANLTA